MGLSYDGGQALELSGVGCEVYRFEGSGAPGHTLLLTRGLLGEHGLEFALRVRGSFDERGLAELLRFWGSQLEDLELGDHDTLALDSLSAPALSDHVAYLTPDPELARDVRVLCWRVVPPAVDAALAGLPLAEVSDLLNPWFPSGVVDLESLPRADDPRLEQAISELRERVPARAFLDGIDFELRLRDAGRALTMLVMPRHLASVLFALRSAFEASRPAALLRDSSVTIESDDACHVLSFRASDDGRARFRVEQVEYQELEGDEAPELETEKARDLAGLSLEALAEEHDLVRRLELSIWAPPELLREALDWAQSSLRGHDFDAEPIVALDWSEHLSDEGYDAWAESAPRGLSALRIWVVSAAYFMGDLAIDDDGNVSELE